MPVTAQICLDKRVFSLEEAKSIFPLVKKLTEATVREVQEQMRVLEKLPTDSVEYDELRKIIEKRVLIWSEKIQKLGGLVRGLWLIDFDSGDGYYCWRYPERELVHFHGYSEGFGKRVPIV